MNSSSQSQTPAEDLSSNDISIYTPPRCQSLEDRLVDAPSAELEDLIEKVLEKRPELRAKFSVKNATKPVRSEKTVEETVVWDDELTGNSSMYRDDNCGWVSAVTSMSEKYKIVGTDFRGLPIVHIGRGRPRTKLISLLQKDPKATPSADEQAQSSATSADGRSLILADLSGPRKSQRLEKKRLSSTSADKTGVQCDADSTGTECNDSQEGITEDDSKEVIDQQFNDLIYIETGSYEVPTEVIAEVSVVSEENRKVFECVECQLVFNSTAAYRKHLSSVDCVGFPYRCYMCQERIENQNLLRVHETSECYLLVTTDLHPQVSLEEWCNSRYLCSICGCGYPREQDLLSHSREAHSSVPVFRCRLCEMSYHELRPLRNHFTKVHLQRAPIHCDICNKQFASKRSLLVHMRHAHQSRLLLKCPLCDKELKSKKSMAHHMSSIHENNRPFTCQYCEKGFVTKSSLEVHMKAHRDIRDHVCEVCGATFIQKVRLTEHMRAHNGVRDYACDLCGRAFYTNKDLKGHERTHTNVKPYICQHCGKTFAQSQGLKKHSLTHNAESLSFKCQFCVKMFKSSGAVYKHCRLMHQDKLTAVCTVCSLRFVSEADLNRHNHYKHLDMYDGTAAERTFLSSTSELTADICLTPSTNSENVLNSYQCVCGESFDHVNDLASHVQTNHTDKELAAPLAADYMVYHQPQHTQEQSDSCQQTMLVGDVLSDSNSQPVPADMANQLENSQSSSADHTSSANIHLSEEGEIVNIGQSQSGQCSGQNIIAGKLVSPPRTHIFQLSTAATGLTEIQQLFSGHH